VYVSNMLKVMDRSLRNLPREAVSAGAAMLLVALRKPCAAASSPGRSSTFSRATSSASTAATVRSLTYM